MPTITGVGFETPRVWRFGSRRRAARRTEARRCTRRARGSSRGRRSIVRPRIGPETHLRARLREQRRRRVVRAAARARPLGATSISNSALLEYEEVTPGCPGVRGRVPPDPRGRRARGGGSPFPNEAQTKGARDHDSAVGYALNDFDDHNTTLAFDVRASATRCLPDLPRFSAARPRRPGVARARRRGARGVSRRRRRSAPGRGARFPRSRAAVPFGARLVTLGTQTQTSHAITDEALVDEELVAFSKTSWTFLDFAAPAAPYRRFDSAPAAVLAALPANATATVSRVCRVALSNDHGVTFDDGSFANARARRGTHRRRVPARAERGWRRRSRNVFARQTGANALPARGDDAPLEPRVVGAGRHRARTFVWEHGGDAHRRRRRRDRARAVPPNATGGTRSSSSVGRLRAAAVGRARRSRRTGKARSPHRRDRWDCERRLFDERYERSDERDERELRRLPAVATHDFVSVLLRGVALSNDGVTLSEVSTAFLYCDTRRAARRARPRRTRVRSPSRPFPNPRSALARPPRRARPRRSRVVNRDARGSRRNVGGGERRAAVARPSRTCALSGMTLTNIAHAPLERERVFTFLSSLARRETVWRSRRKRPPSRAAATVLVRSTRDANGVSPPSRSTGCHRRARAVTGTRCARTERTRGDAGDAYVLPERNMDAARTARDPYSWRSSATRSSTENSERGVAYESRKVARACV